MENLQATYSRGQAVAVEISDAAEVEKCFGRLPNGVGVFVRGPVAVGDRVEAEIYKIKKRFMEARLLRVLEPSPCRVEPPCPVFGTCGGCKWQHVDYDEQLRLKGKIVEDALAHLGGFSDVTVHPAAGADPVFGYRNKVDFSFSDRRFLLPEETGEEPPAKPVDFALGFHAPLRYAKVIDIDVCRLATPAMNEVLDVVRGYCREKELPPLNVKTHAGYLRHLVLRESVSTGELMVNLVTSWHDEKAIAELADVLKARIAAPFTFVNNITDRKSQVAFGDREEVVTGSGTITESIQGFSFTLSSNSFFQTNTRQAEVLAAKVVELAALTPEDVVYDLYAGAGSLSLCLARHGKSVLGTEVIEQAVVDGQANAVRNGIANCLFRQLDMKDFKKVLPELRAWGEPDVVVTDPPRAGMHPKAVQGLCELHARRIVYVSCKPASLARDAKMLCEEGPYRLTEVYPIDMFPQTAHIESVAVLER